MAIEVISIGSSSSGNSYIIKTDAANIILDVGLTAKRIMAALTENGLEPEDVDAVLVTHEHVDHVRSIRAVWRKCINATIFASRGTIENTENFKYISDERVCPVGAGEVVEFGRSVITVFSLSHDAAEPTGYSIETIGRDSEGRAELDGEKLTVVTDTGIITDEIYEVMKDSDILVFEANHDEELLMFGEYPYRLKVRIKGDHGHLSNRYAGEVLAEILEDRRAKYEKTDPISKGDDPETRRKEWKPLSVMLAHLSDQNNAPFYARHTIEDILVDRGFERDIHYTLAVAPKDETLAMFSGK